MKSDQSIKNIKAIVLDLEGALLNSMKDISPAASRILRDMHDRGVMIILCTSQNPVLISRRLRSWQLDDCIPYIIGRWGSSLLNRYTGKLICLAALPEASIENLMTKAAADNVAVCLQQGRSLYTLKNTFLTSLLALKQRKAVVNAPFSSDNPVSSLLITGWPQDLKKLAANLEDEAITLHPAGQFVHSVTSSAASFDQAVNRLLEKHELQPEEVLTIAMKPEFAPLFDSTRGAAMKNADPILFESARWITKYPAAQDGVAYFMNQALISGEFLFGNPACLVHLPEHLDQAAGQSLPTEASAGESA